MELRTEYFLAVARGATSERRKPCITQPTPAPAVVARGVRARAVHARPPRASS
ncbi:MAG: hypothetical protein ACLSGS_04345 [Adlercreutzia sp.]